MDHDIYVQVARSSSDFEIIDNAVAAEVDVRGGMLAYAFADSRVVPYLVLRP